MARLRLKDRQWMRQSFMLPKDAIVEIDLTRREFSTASLKFTDTTIGGNFAINPPPQFTRYADPKAGGNPQIAYLRSVGEYVALAPGSEDIQNNSSYGMGRYYSEAIDDNGQDVVMRFGVPAFNSLASFFGNFYDPAASLLARTGRSSSLFFQAGRAAGFLVALPFTPLIMAGRVVKFLAQIPASKYYYLKPTMPLYFNAVNTIVNGIAVNMGIMPQQLTPGQQQVYGNVDEASTPGDFENFHALLPDIIDKNGRVDVYAIATRAQRIANRYNLRVREGLDAVAGINNRAAAEEATKRLMRDLRNELAQNTYQDPGSGSIEEALGRWVALEAGQPKSEGAVDPATGTLTANAEEYEAIGTRSQYSFGGEFWDYMEGEMRDGSNFVTFRVDFSGSANESFSNSARESSIAQKINSASSSARSTRFDFAEGNIGDGVIAGAVEGVIGATKDFLTGVGAQLQISGLAALAGSALVDIPKVWDSSTANLPRADYTIELRSPYGNKLSRLRNLMIPLAMLLAGALPLSAGKRAYTSPFLCEIYCRGRVAIRLGMIDSLTITRGVGNMGWTDDGEPLGIDVSFSVVDLSSIMHMPIQANFTPLEAAAVAALEGAGQLIGGDSGGEAGVAVGAAIVPSTYDDDNAYTDYLAVLGSLSWSDMVYANRRWNLAKARTIRNYESYVSSSHVASWFFGTIPGRVINAIAQDSDRP